VAPFSDDLDGREADLAITFGIDGILYRIRLSTEHAGDLYDLLAPLRDRGKRVGLVNLPEAEIQLPTVEHANRAAHWSAGHDWAVARGIDLPVNRQPPREVMAAFDLERALDRRDHLARANPATPQPD
jgi:hypothetical protein